MQESQQIDAQDTQTPGGLGGRSERTESGLTSIKEGRLARRAVEDGWLGSRFPTRTKKEDIQKQIEEGGDTAVNLATRTAINLMGDYDPRNQRAGAAIVVAMEAQNQRDELSQESSAASGPLAGANIQNAQIVLMVPDNGRGPAPQTIENDNG